MSYLQDLALRLAAGAMKLPEETRQRHAAYLLEAQADNGGFAGRKGAADPYYTGFALRGLALLGRLDNETAARAGRFLADRLGQQMPNVDFISLIFAALLLEVTAGIDIFTQTGRERRELVAETLGPMRRDDGGYAKSNRSRQSSTYHTFLASLCRQLVGLPLEATERTVELVRSRHREDGGFVEIAQANQSGTNPTAAAVGLFSILDAFQPDMQDAAARFLARMQNAEGGLRANDRIPLADLLSTFTGLVSLVDLDRLDAVDPRAARQYVTRLDSPRGGFLAGSWDETVDVEYTFYGLAAMSLLATHAD